MLRFAYRCLLRLHPPYFRRRFSGEMLSIFDQQKSTWATARLLTDGIVSWFRQWVLRPDFWEEPATQPAADGVPAFYMMEGFKLRPGAFFDGGIVSVVAFTSICLIMGYTWSHPARGPVISVYNSGSQIFWRPPISSASQAGTAAERPIYVDGGRVVVMIQVPGKSSSASVGSK